MATDEHPRPLLTIPEAAERLNLSTTTVRRRIWEGEIPAVRLGLGSRAPVRVDPDELDAYVYGAPPAASLDERDAAADRAWFALAS
jgi:excisionase family DNA binding protein